MKRRQFLTAGAGVAATAVAMPAIAQSTPEIKWRVTSAVPKSFDAIYGVSETISKYVAEATDNKFQIQVFGPGELVPVMQAADAVTNGTIEMTHTASYYFFGKDPTFAFGSTVPFGLNARQQAAWWMQGGGDKLMNEFYRKFNIHALMAGNTGCQMGGWFRKEIKSMEDMKGLKLRISGLGGQVMMKMGVVPQQIAAADIFPALEKGTIDAVELNGPYDDVRLGFGKVAPFYYYPGWWDAGTMLHNFVNLAKWEALPKGYKAILETASVFAGDEMLTKYDARNPKALVDMVRGGGVQLKAFPQDVMAASLKAANEVYAEINARNADFKKVYDSHMGFRNDSYLWWQVAEYTYDNFMIRNRQG